MCDTTVTIDYEDREQAEQLIRLFWANSNDDCDDTRAMQAALREFANPTPPKPEEPLGLGAVVIDAAGRRYVRCDQSSTSRWHCADDETGAYDDFYADIPAVRVLSEGVTP